MKSAMNDEEHRTKETNSWLKQAHRDLNVARKLVGLATTRNNALALTPAIFAFELATEAIRLLEAALTESDADRLRNLREEAVVTQDSCAGNIDEALDALTAGSVT